MNTTMRTNNILAVADWFQMFWSNTVARVTEMVEGHAFGYRTDKLLVSPAVGIDRLVVDGEDPISTIKPTCINPAISQSLISRDKSVLDNTPPKSFFRCLRHIMKWISMSVLGSVVLRAKAQFKNWVVTEAAKCSCRIIRSATTTSDRITVALPPRIMSCTPTPAMNWFRTIINRANHNMPPVANVTYHYTTLAKGV